MKLKQFFIISFLACCLIAAPALFADNLPDLGDPSQALLPQALDKQLGKQFMQQLSASGRVIDDPIDAQYINSVGRRLVTAAGVDNQHFFFFFLADPAINSFAGPYGYIAVDTGLMLETRSEDELAAVMSHEIAHVTQGHLARKLADKSHLKFSMLAGMLAAIALGHVSGEAAESAVAATVAGSQQSMLNFSREYEEEADRVGISTLVKAGFDPNSMAAFFQRLSDLEQLNSQPPALLSDHPLTAQRVADAENRAALYPHHSDKSSEDYYLIKERLRVQTSEDRHLILLHYQQALVYSNPRNRDRLEYGLALAMQANAKYPKAQEILTSLLKDNPDQLLYKLGLADVLVDENQTRDALAILQPVSDIYPDNYPLMIQYAYTLMRAGQARKAQSIVDHYHLNYPTFPVPYALLSAIQAKAGELALAYQTRAAYLVSIGAPQAALVQLGVALKLPHNSPDTVARIRAQGAEIESEMNQ